MIRRNSASAVVACVAVFAAVSCVRAAPDADQPFSTPPPAPSQTATSTPPPSANTQKPFPKACPAPDALQGCLDAVTGLQMNADGQSAYVGERVTGAIKLVSATAEPTVFATIAVDAASDGGLQSIALSPSFEQDRLIYAYVTTPTDNRVVRIAQGDQPKVILAGIPKGPSGNRGSLLFTAPDKLVVQTGDAAGSAAPDSLAGKLLTVNLASPGTPAITARGLGNAGGVCADRATGDLYVTDRSATEDRLQRVAASGSVTPVWSWPSKPGVAGCVFTPNTVVVNLSDTKQTVGLTLAADSKTVTGPVNTLVDGAFGHTDAAVLGPDGTIWGGTVNKTYNEAGQFDDRVVPLIAPGAAGGGGID